MKKSRTFKDSFVWPRAELSCKEIDCELANSECLVAIGSQGDEGIHRVHSTGAGMVHLWAKHIL